MADVELQLAPDNAKRHKPNNEPPASPKDKVKGKDPVSPVLVGAPHLTSLKKTEPLHQATAYLWPNQPFPPIPPYRRNQKKSMWRRGTINN
jgi:hypothetical protein